MYQVVLAAALATSATAPNHCFARFHCHGYAGYSGYAAYAPYAWCGCQGSCAAPVMGYGAAGGCYGYHGGCYGGWGVFTNELFPYGGCTGCYGCYGGYAGYGVPVPLQPMMKDQKGTDAYPPINPDAKKKDKGPGGEEVAPPKEKKKDKKDQSRGTIRMTIPEGAKLFVDGRQIEVTPGTRVFTTPSLVAGQSYFYDFRVEVTRDGAILTDERRVIVRAGEETAAVFANIPPPANTAAATR